MTSWSVPGVQPAASAVSMNLQVGGACVTLSSLDNNGFSLNRNGRGFDIEFTNFSGTLNIQPAQNTFQDTTIGTNQDVSSLPETSTDFKVDAVNADASQLYIEDNLCDRLQACIKQSPNREPVEVVPTENAELHLACALPNISVRELNTILKARPEAASQVDELGKYPLHVLSENSELLASLVDYPREFQYFVLALVEAYPEALFTKDDAGYVPFVDLIQEFVQDSYRKPLETSSGFMGMLQQKAAKMIITTSTDSGEQLQEEPSYDKFPSVVLMPAVMTALKILSTFLDRVNECTSPRETQLCVRAAMAEPIASIPYLLKTIYLIEINHVRHKVLHSRIIQRVLYCKESVGDGWVSNMLRCGGVPSKRAVDYLQDISAVTAADYAGQTPLSEDTEAYNLDRKQLFDALEISGQLIPSLTLLQDDEKGRAATTDAVWTIINRHISRPLVFGMQSADFVFNVLLIMTFRYATGTNNLVLAGTNDALSDKKVDMLVSSLCFYFFWRKLNEIYSMMSISMMAFKSYNSSFWHFIDITSIIFATAATFSKTDNEIFLAVTMALLWLRFLSFLKAVNTHMATFIIAVVEIVKDIRWFLVVLTICIFMFADVIQIITEYDVNNPCAGGDAPEEFCNSEMAPIFLKLFAVLVGDMSLNEFKYSGGIQILFLLFSLLGVIVLLNVLIAVVSDSYQKAVEHSSQLFGRERLNFVVKFVAQENFLRGTNFPAQQGCGPACFIEHSVWFIGLAGRLVALSALVWTAVASEYCLVLLAKATYKESAFWVFMSVLCGIVFVISIPTVLQDIAERPLRRFADRVGFTWGVAYLDATHRAGRRCAKLFFAIGTLDTKPDEGDPRVKMIEKSMIRIATSTKDSIVVSMEAVESRMKAHTSTIGESISLRMDALSGKS